MLRIAADLMRTVDQPDTKYGFSEEERQVLRSKVKVLFAAWGDL